MLIADVITVTVHSRCNNNTYDNGDIMPLMMKIIIVTMKIIMQAMAVIK